MIEYRSMLGFIILVLTAAWWSVALAQAFWKEKKNAITSWIIVCVTVAVMIAGSVSAGSVAPNEVCIYEHVDFVGASRCFRVEPWMRHKLVPTLGSFNDRSSSLQVGTGVIVMLYPHANYGGGSVLYEKSFAHLDGGNDQVSSLIIRPKAAGEDWRAALRSGGGFGVKLREKDVGKQESGFYPLPERLDELEARYPVLGKMNDKANIVWLRGDIEVILFEHANFAGKPLKLPGAGYTPASDQVFNLLKYQFGRRASSLVVRARGPQQQILPGQIKLPPPPPPREGSEGTKHRAPSAPVSIAPKTIKSIQPASEFEMETNRPGQDYRSFDLAAPDPKQCRNACLEDKNCRAWSYVKPGVQGSKARCWLKNAVPPAKPSNCCISGVK